MGGGSGGDTGGVQRSDQSYGHAVLAESESSICRLLQSLSEVVPLNMADTLVTLLTSKFKGWLNAAACSNMMDIEATMAVSNDASGWLSAAAPLNILCIVGTADVSNDARGWLKAAAR